MVLYQEGNERLSPKYVLLRVQYLLHEALIAYGYELAKAGKPPAWETGSADCPLMLHRKCGRRSTAFRRGRNAAQGEALPLNILLISIFVDLCNFSSS